MRVYDNDDSLINISALLSNDDSETYQHKSYIFHVCYELTGAPRGSFKFLSLLSLVQDFDRPEPVKVYDRWLAKVLAPNPNDKESVERIMAGHSNARRALFRWQRSENGLLLLKGEFTQIQNTRGEYESFYLYEFPFRAFVQRVWDRCNPSMFTPQIKEIAKEEFDVEYPERGTIESLGKREQSLEEMQARAASTIASLIREYKSRNPAYDLNMIQSTMAFDMNEILEEKGEPRVFKDPLEP